jgi:hypothetical protein
MVPATAGIPAVDDGLFCRASRRALSCRAALAARLLQCVLGDWTWLTFVSRSRSCDECDWTAGAAQYLFPGLGEVCVCAAPAANRAQQRRRVRGRRQHISDNISQHIVVGHDVFCWRGTPRIAEVAPPCLRALLAVSTVPRRPVTGPPCRARWGKEIVRYARLHEAT